MRPGHGSVAERISQRVHRRRNARQWPEAPLPPPSRRVAFDSEAPAPGVQDQGDVPQGHHVDDHHDSTYHDDHEDADELVAAAHEAAAKELGRRPLKPPALLLASRQRWIQSRLLLAWLRGPLVAFRLRLRFTFIVLGAPQHDLHTAAVIGWCADRE